jgi:hypothetical protein
MSKSRATKTGDAFRQEQKMLQRYEEEEKLGTPQRLTDWINKVLEGDVTPCKGSSQPELYEHWKDGVVLCKLVNKLLEAAGKPKVSFKAKAGMAFAQMENIGKFTQAAETYGVPSSCLFETVDLHEGNKANFVNVINCLNTLGFTANKNGFKPQYEHIEAPTLD